MKTGVKILIFFLICISGVCNAQREVTPVVTDDKKPETPTLHYYDKHGNALKEPVLFLATLDTVASVKSNAAPLYPRLHALDFGLNFMDAIFVAAGQHYGGADLRASLSMWNWLFPTIELGLGGARYKPSGLNYTYKGNPSPYLKIGADYNFLYKSNPDYRLLVGLRGGFSSFSYSLADVTVSDSYWDNTVNFSIPGQHATAFYGELLAGISVKIINRFSLAWSLRYRFMFHCTDGTRSRPWYIPGFGSRSNKFGATLSLIYTLPLSGHPTEESHEEK